MWDMDIVDLHIPLTLSKKEIKKLGIRIDFVDGNIKILGISSACAVVRVTHV